MYEIQFPKNKKAKSRQWDNPDEPVELVSQLRSEGWAGIARVVDLSNNEVIYSKYVCSLGGIMIKFVRKSRFVRLSKKDLHSLISAVSAAQAQVLQDGTKIKEGDTDAFLLQAGVAVHFDDLRGRLVSKVRTL